jgi:2-polyprenyl-6-methoxyphenol hydroxylase-like FAD-dependent oxidoreductase
MGLVAELRAIRYPIDALQFVDAGGRVQVDVPIERVRRALGGRYVYLRRTDLAGILYRRAREAGVEIRFGTTVKSLQDRGDDVRAIFSGGGEAAFALVFGADGIHSRVRELAFGPEQPFDRFLGYYVAAFHVADHGYDVGRAFKLYEEPNRLVGLYPLDQRRLDATYVFRHADIGPVPHGERLALIRRAFAGAGWLAERLLDDYPSTQPLYFDPTMQIVMPDWHKGRVALLGDACGCLTLLAGQGSHMAMAGAYVLAQELSRHGDDHRAAFAAYQQFLKPHVARKQRDAAWLSRLFVPTERSRPALRRAVVRLIFSRPLAKYALTFAGAKSVLAGR